MVMEQREKIENGWKKDKRFEGEGGGSAALAERGRLYSRGIQAEGVRIGSQSAISKKSRDASGGSSKSESCQEL